MKNNILAIAAGLACLGMSASAEQNSIFAMGSFSDADESFGLLSYTRYLNEDRTGLSFRGSISALSYDVGNTNVDRTAARALVGYNIGNASNGLTSLYLGVVVDEDDDSDHEAGVFVGAEHYQPVGNGSSVFFATEYSSPNEDAYIGGHYEHSFGGFGLGPAVSYFHTDDYEATTYGLRGSVQVGAATSLISSVSGRHSNASGESSTDSVVFDIGVYVAF